MKRKFLAWLMTLAMVVNMVVPYAAYADELPVGDDTYVSADGTDLNNDDDATEDVEGEPTVGEPSTDDEPAVGEPSDEEPAVDPVDGNENNTESAGKEVEPADEPQGDTLVVGDVPNVGTFATPQGDVMPVADGETATVIYNITATTDAKGKELGFDKTTFYTTANGGNADNNGNADSIKFDEAYSVTALGTSSIIWRSNDVTIVKNLVGIAVTVDGVTGSLLQGNIGEGTKNYTFFGTDDLMKNIKVCRLNSGTNDGKYNIFIGNALKSADKAREITIKYIFEDSANFTLSATSNNAGKGSVLGTEYLKHKNATTDIYRVYTSATEGNRLNGYTLGDETVLLLDSEKITGTYGDDNTACVYFDIEVTANTAITVNFDEIPAAGDGWNGTVDTTWYNKDTTEFTLTTPAQLAGLAAIVNGSVEGVTEDFSGKTIKLGADIKLNDVDFTYSADVNRVEISNGVNSVYEALTVDKGTGDNAPDNTAFTFYTSKSAATSVASRSDDKQVTAGGLSWWMWTPIGNSEKPFKGTFDGQNHSITNMYYAGYGKDVKNIGLFGYVNGTIKNLTVDGVVAGNTCVGGIAGWADNSRIEDCTNKVTVIGTTYRSNNARAGASNIGGVVGKVSTGAGAVISKNLKNNGIVLGNTNVGGVVGFITGSENGAKVTFNNCTNTALVSGYSISAASNVCIGGVFGRVANDTYNNTDVSVEFNGLGNSGDINILDKESYNQYVGGVIGSLELQKSISDIKNCYNTGDVSGRKFAGGIIGNHTCASYSACFRNAYNAGKVSCAQESKLGNGAYVNCGSVVGQFLQNPAIIAGNVWENVYQAENTYYVAGKLSSTGGFNDNLTELTNKAMKVASFAARLGDAFAVDKAGVNKGYPVLIGDSVGSNAKAITEFKLGETAGTVDETTKTITVNNYAFSATDDRIYLQPVISVSEKATVSPASGVATEFVQDATDNTLYTAEYLVTAENGSVAAYTVKVYTTAAVSSVDVSMYSISVVAGYGNYQLNATVAPVNAANQQVTWSSADPSIATVDQTGLVTGVSAGTTTITLTTQDGGKTASCEVTVQQFVAVTGITLPETAAVSKSQTIELAPTFTPSNASNQEVTWSSSAPDVAAVDENGVVTGLVDSGTAVITVTSKDTTNGTISASCTVTVKELPVEGITVTQTKNLAVGKGKKLKVTFNPSNASNKAVTWESSAPGIATVDKDGVVRGVATGEATITATAVDTTNGILTASVKLNVVSDYDYSVGWAGVFNANDNNNNKATVALPTPAKAVDENWYASVGNSAVCVVGDYVYAYACAQGMMGFDMKGNVKSFYKIDKNTGEIVKEIKNCPGAGGFYYGYVLYGDGQIYVVCPSVVMAFDIDACEMLWSQSITYRQYCAAQYVNGYVVANGCVVDGATGELKTKLDGKYCYSSGAVVGDNFYIAGYDGYLHAFDTTTWAEVDSYKFGNDQGETEGWDIKLQPGVLYHQGRFYWSSRSGLYSIALNDGKLDPDSYKFLSGPQSSVCTPVAYGNRVYQAGQMGQIDVYSTETLELIYSTDRLSSKIQSTPVLYGDESNNDVYVYVQSYDDSAIYCLHDTATATSGKLQHLVTPSHAQYAFEQIACDTDGALYCTNDAGYLFRFTTKQAKLPQITTDLSTEPVTYTKGAKADALTVAATLEGDYTLSYQWQSSANDVANEYADIEGATGSSYTPDVSKTGTTFYRCKVISSAGASVYVLSSSAQIRVEEGSSSGGNTGGGTTPTEKTVSVTINFSMNGELVVHNASLNVRDTDGDKKYTMHDAFYVLHEKYDSVDNYEGSSTGWVTKFWGDTSMNYGYTQNHKWVNGTNQVINSGDKLDVYILQDTSNDYTDLLTWFDNNSYSAKTGVEKTFTVNGMYVFGSSSNNKQLTAKPKGATVTVTDEKGNEYVYETDENGQFKVTFSDAGLYTIDVTGSCSFSVSKGENPGEYTGAPVVPSRCTVSVSGNSTGGSMGGSTTTETKYTATEVIDLIDAIGTVTKDSKFAIEKARAAYDSLTEAQQKKVTNYDKLTAAEAKYTELTGEKIEVTTGSDLPFADVKSDAWYFDAIKAMYDKGLMNGESEKEFVPNNKLSRAMLVTILYRLAEQPEVSADALFDDVAAGQWYTKAVAWANGNNIVSGVGDGKFAPNDSITRQELAAMLYRYASATGLNTTATANLSSFSDSNSVATWAETAMQWAVGSGLIKGDETGALNPTGTATRAEVATVIVRLIEMIAK